MYLPEYAQVLGKNWTVHLTPIGSANNLYASEVQDGYFDVFGLVGKFSWIVYGTREEIDTEPLKVNAHVNGTGPYRWLSR